MSDPIFVPHITLDGIVTLLSFIGAATVYIIKRQRAADRTNDKLDDLSAKVQDHGMKLDRLVAVAEVQARHDERLIAMTDRIDLMERRYEEMRHGEGYVLPLEEALRARGAKPQGQK